ncbi:hypothetical protein M970_020250 [Encephalitozoon cuniculi EcunIII-L]|nr:hypothetical protein M970_020250 [Encephalitozoon cuniculi EcunIII-L]
MVEDEARGVLFILNESLVANGSLSPDHRKCLEKMISLIDEDPVLLGLLDEWRFLERQFPCLLRDSADKHEAVALATRVLQYRSSLPALFMTRKGGFLLSETLYDSMDDSQGIIAFCEEASKKNSLFPGVLYDCGFFILLNSLVSEETARFYSSIFAYKIHEGEGRHAEGRGEEMMHEIRRRYFDPEIAFTDRGHLSFRKPPSLHRVGHQVLKDIFDDIYNTAFFSLLDLGLDKNLHLMNYCEWDYFFLCGSPELRELVASGNYLAIRLYRRMLESFGKCTRAGLHLRKVEDEDLMAHITKLLECKDAHMTMECALVLYNYYQLFGWSLDKRQFSENRIREIFSLLEYSYTNCQCFQECVYGRSDDSAAMGMEDSQRAKCLVDCNTMKILSLLSNIYSCADKRYFYKPSFLVLMRTWSDVFSRHKCWDCVLFTTFFTDVLELFRANPYNIARIIFPFKRSRRRPKGIVDEVSDKENSSCFPRLANGIDPPEIEDLDE